MLSCALFALSLAAIAILLGWLARVRALARPELPVEPRWFACAQQLQWLLLAFWLGWCLLVPGRVLDPALSLRQELRADSWFGALLLPLVFLVPPVLVTNALALIQHGVGRRLGTTELTGADLRRQLLWLDVLMLAPAALGLGLATHAFGEGRAPAGAAWALAAVVVGLIAAARWRDAIGMTPEAVSSGELREAIFALAARGGVRLQQLYVVPVSRSRLANAFAVQGGVVMLTDYLLQRLHRREVEAVMAHEVAHLKLGHTRVLGWVRTAALAGPMVLALYQAPWGWVLATLVAGLLLMGAVSRRCEYAADAGALDLGADAESLVSALVRITRLNFVPQRWARGLGLMLTHPPLDARAAALGRKAGIGEARIAELLAGAATAGEPYALPATLEGEGKVFSSKLKAGRLAGYSWSVLAAGALTAVVVVAMAAAAELPLPRLALVAIALGTAFGAQLLAGDAIATRVVKDLRARLATRLGPAIAEGARFAGFAPDAAARVYEGYGVWDLGFVRLEPGRLEFSGEECRFQLAPAQVVAVELVEGLPSWIRTRVVRVRWQDASGAEAAFRLAPAGHGWQHETSAHAAELREQLEAWRAAGAPAGYSASFAAAARPPVTPVTSRGPADELGPRLYLMLVIVQCLLSGAFAAMAGLGLGAWSGPGWFEAALATAGASVLQTLPLLRHREPEPLAAERPEARQAA
jgi:Zn-dependent protease with chaperone function